MIQKHLKFLLFLSNLFQKFTCFSYKIEIERDFPSQQQQQQIDPTACMAINILRQVSSIQLEGGN